ncbi:MAG: tRNA (adenosine(37)-N6)-threonylcarbamoyltransferase complex ATPase subunit type 1 TsaE [Sphingomonadaceae bacterium]|uniref:tRNA (adenosine(37)-N6)-threonylcarbamoyltransferase complex ATPase subunit type 1 TsaE n=1 Tax=Thermaurantiacus sp. TaxID=2820283 RepID=UPI00298F01C8|nr:tRNA (adenosine(37)-N6)-threonylcarbamoyltransferase complex ATPase subunit type 1 TsaE [Thermaurantiacus sp.]MCS6986410.1 tRNA (adenosine(37)-N6)-threonylcarbamoyltransferase complex ATPase subunit type 1 TsaE [Sphingomonadaceae bacterium]MDW8414329.1 tRNA (adenosine(37)-N6)-threonylcarbamoyltransferase complex ATPase subunit type 1 TsaE [Thermaurantiacus sp.]
MARSSPITIATEPFDLDGFEAFAAALAHQLAPGDALLLSGELGAGKTTFARAVLKALGHPGDVPSPTWTLVELYPAPPLRLPAAHADLFRLPPGGVLDDLDLEGALADGILLLEWPERLGPDRFPQALHVRIEPEGADRRRLTCSGGPAWSGRLPPAGRP